MKLRHLAVALLFLPVGAAWAEDRPRLSVMEENDKFASRNDRNYTQGIMFSWLTSDISNDPGWSAPFDAIAEATPILNGEGKRKYRFSLGQSIFTPTDTEATRPLYDQRPYAGWTYVGVSLLQDHDGRSLETLEAQLGVVGPMALGRQAQNGWHKIINVDSANGWDNQIRNEPGIVLSYDRRWRLGGGSAFGVEFDAIPEAGATIGNIFTYAQAGGIIRIGRNLGADYGPGHIRPVTSSAQWFDGDRMNGDFGWYLFVGAGGRAIARNIFLDGNSWKDSPSIDKEPFVGDFRLGASIFWSDRAKLDFSLTHRSQEYKGQNDSDTFGMLGLTFGF